MGENIDQVSQKIMRFIDWPPYHDKKAVHAGIQALLLTSFEKGANLVEYYWAKTITWQSITEAECYIDLGVVYAMDGLRPTPWLSETCLG